MIEKKKDKRAKNHGDKMTKKKCMGVYK